MSSVQLSEWMAWANIRGMPEARADFRSGQICAVLANIHRTRDAAVFTPDQFFPKRVIDAEEEAREEPETIDVEAASRQLAAMLGKKE